jgi:hypothetical protein
MANDFEYYLIGSDNTPSVPLLMPDDNQDTMMLHGRKPIKPLEKPMELCFRPPVPRKPRMVDFHELPSPVFSQKICDILQPMNINGLQLLPAIIRGKDNNFFKDYWVAYIYNRIACLDMEHSQYSIDDDGKVDMITRFLIDNKKLSKTPLKKRLIFLLEEDMPKRIYHKSIVDAIMSVNPVGIQFYPIQEWYEGIQFDEEDW